MKRNQFLIALFIASSITLFSQSPDAFQYQAMIRDTNGILISNQVVTVRFKIHQTNTVGSVIFIETHQTTTSKLGLIHLKIGNGTPEYGTIALINWVNGPFFIETEVDKGSGYISTGTQQLLSVPFSKYAQNTQNVQLKSPNGKLWNISIDDNGNISTVEKTQQ